ncbi:MAG: DUF6602 domain-containing protein [Candidatus Nanoarchaeia archaeon]
MKKDQLTKIFGIRANLLIEQLALIKEQPEAIRGRAREMLINDFLKPFLPDNLGIDGGVVISSLEDKSDEIDIVIYEKKAFSIFKPFTHFMPAKAKPFPAEVVYCVVEVEYKLTLKRFEELIKKIQKIKQMPKTAYFAEVGAIKHGFNMYGKKFDYMPIMGVIFAYNSPPLNQLQKILKKYSAVDLEHQVDLVCVLNRGVVGYVNTNTSLIHLPPEPDCKLTCLEKDPANCLQLLYLLLMRILAQAWSRPIRILDYFK